MLLILAPEGGGHSQLRNILMSTREQRRDYIVHAEFFDPWQESPRRFDHFADRIDKVKVGHFEAVILVGGVSNSHIRQLLEVIPDVAMVGNYADQGSVLDQHILAITGAQNSSSTAQGKP